MRCAEEHNGETIRNIVSRDEPDDVRRPRMEYDALWPGTITL